tara:strand:- start:597 stop:713 length:117 start_codon:yes stop_codon:yes gene_type:complete
LADSVLRRKVEGDKKAIRAGLKEGLLAKLGALKEGVLL